ncbi:hypothetical protein ABZV34_23985 [Streptomyces sp. NPDC005195]|uniref:hypothetical protein n=1 Tax=Streptomyces sp. NPDC005195 TaxID=3154561 RepID=UPI0033A9D00B
MLNPAPPAPSTPADRFPLLTFVALTDMPHVSDRNGTTIAPYSASIAYRPATGSRDLAWTAQVSGYRVLPNGVVDMDSTCIELNGATDRDLIPDALLARIEGRIPLIP